MRVLALDPGEKVGWARADVSPTGAWSDVRHGITPLRDMAIAVHKALCEPYIDGTPDTHLSRGNQTIEMANDYDVVVCEDWRLYPHMAQQFVGSSFPSVKFIGAVELACWVSGTKLVKQGAAVKKPALAMMAKFDPTLHAKVTRSGAHDDLHDMDALIHMWRYTERTTELIPHSKVAA